MVLAFFLIFVVLLGGVIPRVKGSSSKRENLDNFLHQMDDSGLICLDTIHGGRAYRQECLLV